MSIDEATAPSLLLKPRLSHVAAESDMVMRLAIAGSDKAMPLYHTILGKRQGPMLDDEILQTNNDVENPSWCQCARTVSLDAAHVTNALLTLGQAILAWKEQCIWVRLSLDDSRVSGLEITLSHLVVA